MFPVKRGDRIHTHGHDTYGIHMKDWMNGREKEDRNHPTPITGHLHSNQDSAKTVSTCRCHHVKKSDLRFAILYCFLYSSVDSKASSPSYLS